MLGPARTWVYVSFDDINRKKRNFQLSHNQSAMPSSYKEVINRSFLPMIVDRSLLKLISPIKGLGDRQCLGQFNMNIDPSEIDRLLGLLYSWRMLGACKYIYILFGV